MSECEDGDAKGGVGGRGERCGDAGLRNMNP